MSLRAWWSRWRVEHSLKRMERKLKRDHVLHGARYEVLMKKGRPWLRIDDEVKSETILAPLNPATARGLGNDLKKVGRTSRKYDDGLGVAGELIERGVSA